MVSYNSPGPLKHAVAIDYIDAFAGTANGIQRVEARTLLTRHRLSLTLDGLYHSPTWKSFYKWASHPFNKWIGYEALETWNRNLTEGEVYHPFFFFSPVSCPFRFCV
jgi:hypothetical protein